MTPANPIQGEDGNVGRAAYGASKGGVVMLTQVMAVELAGDDSGYVTGHTLVVDGGFPAGGLLPP
jgi:NAD(P)-dependent dehydrogenase (short-subunit alcohol dehydrogenase family)